MDDLVVRKRLPRFLRNLALAVYSIFVPFLLIPAVLLVVAAETAAGRWFGIMVLCALSAPYLLVFLRRRWGLGAGAAAVILLGVVASLTPPGRPTEGSRAGSHFLGDAGYRRFSVWNLCPEIDQIKVATFLIPALDAYVDFAEARRIREVVLPILREMEEDPEFHALGSVMNYAYSFRDAEHVYTYVPEHEPGASLPAIVFLHGSVGNFKSYLWVWRRFADANGCVIVCPSFGFGTWYQAGGAEAVERARAWAVATLPVDPDRVWLAGISNGAYGVSAAGHGPYQGLIYLSPIPELVAGPRVLVIHGSEDDRVALSRVDAAVQALRDAGVDVDYRVYEGEDHFLFYSSLDRAFGDIADWLPD